MWAFLAFGAAVLTSFNPIFYKRMLKDADALVVVWGVISLSLPLLGLFTFVLTPQLPRLDPLFAVGVLGSAVLNVVARLAAARALKLADASLIAPLLLFSPAFTVLISAVVLGEIPSVRGILGVGLVLIGAYWLTRTPGEGWLTPLRSLNLSPAVLLVLLTGLMWAITPVFEKTAILHTQPESPPFTAFVASTLLALLLTPAALRRGKPAIRNLSLHRRELWLAALTTGIAPVLVYTAFSLGYVGYVDTLLSLNTLMTVVWGCLFLKEHGIAQRLPGSLVMVLGAILIPT
jgi:drug/metabolite transporter (DMT)-like permease